MDSEEKPLCATGRIDVLLKEEVILVGEVSSSGIGEITALKSALETY